MEDVECEITELPAELENYAKETTLRAMYY